MQPLSFTTIDAFDSVHEANVAVAILEQNGIDCFTENETLIANDWLLAGAVGGVKIQVPVEQVPRAREVLAEWRRNRAERFEAGKNQWIVFRCSSCKELIAIGAEHANRVENCPRCRRYVDVPGTSDPSLTEEMRQATIESSKDRKRQSAEHSITAPWFLVLECLVVLGFAYVPYQVWAIHQWYSLEGGESSYVGFLSIQSNAALIVQSLIVMISLLAILVVHGSLKPHGITSEKAGHDAILGIAIGTGLFLFEFLLASLMGNEGLFSPISPDSRSAGIEGWIAIAGSGLIGLLLNSIAEELVMRGYLTIRLEQLTGNAYLAVIIPAILFAGYHIYQGLFGAVMAGLTGIVLGTWFFKTRRLLGPIIAHSCFNLCCMLQELLWTWVGS